MSTLDLIGRVTARRLRDVRETAKSRAFYCLIGLDPAVTSAIARHVATDGLASGLVEVLVHPRLNDGSIAPAVESDLAAPWIRNHPTSGKLLTLCTVPADKVKETIPTLEHNAKIDDAWLLQDPAIWAEEGLDHSSAELRASFAETLRGVLASGVAHDAVTIASFVSRVHRHMDKAEGLTLEKAVRAALPELRLPRNAGDPRLKVGESSATAERFFRKTVDEAQPALTLKTKDGDPLNKGQLRERLLKLRAEGVLDVSVADALTELLDDRSVRDGSWTDTQRTVAELGWDAVEPFFSDLRTKVKQTFGAETKEFFDQRYPGILKKSEEDLLVDLPRDSMKPSERIDAFFAEHKVRLQSNAKLYKRWEKLVFRAAIETGDLAEGLLRLAHLASPEGGAEDDDVLRVLVVKLRNARRLDFWTTDKNTRVLRYLRDRYRGLADLLAPHVVLDFGRCWSEDWETQIPDAEDVDSRARTAVDLEFEASLVPPDQVQSILDESVTKPHANRAQMLWRPSAEALGLSLPLDLRLIRPKDEAESTRLMTGAVQQNRSARGPLAATVDLAERTTMVDSFGQSDGLLANVNRTDHRIDLVWPRSLDGIVAQGVLTAQRGAELKAAFDSFVDLYGSAIRDLLHGSGIGSQLLLDQAEAYGDLLDTVMRGASQEVCITDLLAPLTRLGVVEVDGEQLGAIVTAWHPLRLAEIAAKARQLAASMARIVTSTGDQRAGVEDFVNDRVATHAGTYYGDVAVLNVPDPTLFAETQSVADYTLLEVTTGIQQHGATDEPTESAVTAFDRVGNEYLKLRPHERANFSVVILNADSENLPLAMANGLARRIEDDPDIRCELVVTDDDPTRLRQVYERQNRRISLEIDSGLASEAARSFLSRLRVGIFSPETLAQQGGQKANDIVLLQDVISRSSSVRWSKGELNPDPEPIETFVPTARSKRRPFRKGNTTSALYLTAPRQPAACRSYVDAVRNVIERDVVLNDEPWLPVQEVAFRTGEVHDILAKAHALGVWVMTFDRVADRRLISSDARRIIRYFSVPGSTHNVIVSTEITVDDLGDCISDGLDVILPGADIETLAMLRRQIFERAAQLSGDVVMRGAQWSNYASELLGLVLAQREVDRLLRDGRENRTAWFFLDDYYEWLDLSGERADILAIDFSVAAGQPEIRIVIAEAKYVGQEGIAAEEKRSAGQLEKTWLALHQRLLGGDVNLDPAIWRHRLADMILEHMDPFDQVGGIAQDEWLEALRTGTIPLVVDGHSLIFSHDRLTVTEPMPRLPDSVEPIGDRRRLAQWLFARDETAAMLRALPDDAVPPSIAIPEGWPRPESDNGTPDAEDDPDAGPNGDLPSASNAPSDAVGERFQDGQGIVRVSLTHDVHDETATVDDHKADRPVPQESGPWSPEIVAVLRGLSRAESQADGEAWLESQIAELRTALQTENVDAPILGQRLTPNTGLVYVGGRTLTTGWLERKQRDLLTRYGLDIVRISPMPGQIAIGLRRPKRSILHLADAWLRRTSVDGPAQLAAPLLGEREDDGQPCFLPLAAEYYGQERAAPHSLISGTTGSGKGILVTNLMLDLCALNGPEDMELHLIDPKRGVDYAWARRLPQLRGGIVDSQDDAKALLLRLVADMEARYEEIAAENCRNIDQYNRKVTPQRRMPRVVIFFDEVANWMQDDDFKDVVDGLINKIATKSRAAGFHLFMVYQRADNQVMTMQLRTNLGNKLILRLGDEGSSKIALNEKGAERLLGKGHLIAKLDTDEKIYLQVPYIGDEEVEDLAEAVIDTWTRGRRQEAAE